MASSPTTPLAIADEKARYAISRANYSDGSQTSSEADSEIEKRVIRKCDWRVIPPTIIIFALSFIDR